MWKIFCWCISLTIFSHQILWPSQNIRTLSHLDFLLKCQKSNQMSQQRHVGNWIAQNKCFVALVESPLIWVLGFYRHLLSLLPKKYIIFYRTGEQCIIVLIIQWSKWSFDCEDNYCLKISLFLSDHALIYW